MKTVFVDTAALIALGNKQDSFHPSAWQKHDAECRVTLNDTRKISVKNDNVND